MPFHCYLSYPKLFILSPYTLHSKYKQSNSQHVSSGDTYVEQVSWCWKKLPTKELHI